MNDRTHINPIVGDKVTFIETAEESGGRQTVLEVELAPTAKGVPLHYHTVITESFTVLEGELALQMARQKLRLEPGETAVVPVYTKHRFYNASAAPVRFRVTLSPGSTRFENSLKIAYALAREGKCNRHSIPKSLSHLALLFDMGEGRLPGITGLLMPLLKRLAAKAKRAGVDRELVRRYCQAGAPSETTLFSKAANASSPGAFTIHPSRSSIAAC